MRATKDVQQHTLRIVDSTGVLARLRKLNPDGSRAFDIVVISRETWETLPPSERYQGTLDPASDWVFCCVPPDWSPPDHVSGLAATFGFSFPVCVPTSPSLLPGSMMPASR
jgi:hypothetical protein